MDGELESSGDGGRRHGVVRRCKDALIRECIFDESIWDPIRITFPIPVSQRVCVCVCVRSNLLMCCPRVFGSISLLKVIEREGKFDYNSK